MALVAGLALAVGRCADACSGFRTDTESCAGRTHGTGPAVAPDACIHYHGGMNPAAPDLLAAHLDRFIESGLSISVASRDVRNVPSLARAYGCHCRPNGQLAVFVSNTQSQSLIHDLRNTGVIAAVFSRPSSHQTIQIKGHGARLKPLESGDMERIQRQMGLLLADILSLGFQPAPVQTLLAFEPADLLAVEFAPDSVFGQSPGPRAGERLEDVRAS